MNNRTGTGKARKMLSLIIAMCMLITTASAVGYSDTDGHWAESYIDDMTARGLYNGFDDGTFRPDQELTLEQTLAVCVRACGYPDSLAADVLDDHADLLDEILGDGRAWFRQDFAMAIEAGLITPEQLANSYADGSLAKALTREQFTRYLVAAMQLLPPTQGFTMNFEDTAEISSEYAAGVYLLNSLGIIVGDHNGYFNPKNTVKRSDSATMFSRAVAYMEQNGLVPELERFADYSVTAGSIREIAEQNGGTLLTLAQSKGDAVTVLVPDSAKIYEHNIVTDRDAMLVTRYAKVLASADGKVYAVRLYSAPTVYYGSIVTLTADGVVVDTGTVKRTFSFDRSTEVLLGVDTLNGDVMRGGVEIIDLTAGYDMAECVIDETGKLAFLHLTGGNHEEQAILVKVENKTMTVLTYDGRTHLLDASDFEVLIDGGDWKSVKPAIPSTGGRPDLTQYATHGVTLTLDNYTSAVLCADIDSAATYVQGGLTRVTPRGSGGTTISVITTGSTRETTFTFGSNGKAYRDGVKIAVNSLEAGTFITMRMEKSFITEAYTTEGSRTIEGEIAAITYGTIIKIDIEKANGEIETIELDVKKLPTVMRGNKLSGVDKMVVRDAIVVNIKYNAITDIVIASPTADLVATVSGISIDGEGTRISLITDDGEAVNYMIAPGASITQNSKTVALTAVTPGSRVGIVISGSVVTAIDVEEAAPTAGELNGVILFINVDDRTILLQTADGNLTINNPYNTKIINSKGESLSVSSLNIGDAVQIMGIYGSDGVFTAELIIRR